MDCYYDNYYDELKGGKIAINYLKSLLNQSYKNNADENINNKYILDKDLSTKKTKIYKDVDTGDVVMSNRGTSDFKDVLTDIKLLFGYKDKRFNEAKDVFQKVKSKYPSANVDIIGHSLGSSVAEEIGKDPKVKNIITLNKPTTPMDLIRKSKKSDKQYDIRTSKDVVSILQPLQKDKKDIVIPSETNDLYKEHKVDVLDRLKQDLIIGEGLNKKRLNNNDIKNLIKYILKHKKIKSKYSNYDINLLNSLLI